MLLNKHLSLYTVQAIDIHHQFHVKLVISIIVAHAFNSYSTFRFLRLELHDATFTQFWLHQLVACDVTTCTVTITQSNPHAIQMKIELSS